MERLYLMQTQQDSTAFWVDDEYDQNYASDGVSRFGAYIRQKTNVFASSWDGTWDDSVSEWAADVWRIATPPVMAPGYVRQHRRVLHSTVERSHWDGSLTAAVELVTPWPNALESSTSQCARHWRGWPIEVNPWSGEEFFVEPSEHDLTKDSYLLARTKLFFRVPVNNLPTPPSGPDDHLEDRARHTVASLVTELSRVVTPLLEALREDV